MAQPVEHLTLDLRVMSLRPMRGIEVTLKKSNQIKSLGEVGGRKEKPAGGLTGFCPTWGPGEFSKHRGQVVIFAIL